MGAPDPPPKKKIGRPPNVSIAFWWGSDGGNRLRQTGYSFLKKFLEKGSNTPDQGIGPPNFKNAVAPLDITAFVSVLFTRTAAVSVYATKNQRSFLSILES